MYDCISGDPIEIGPWVRFTEDQALTPRSQPVLMKPLRRFGPATGLEITQKLVPYTLPPWLR